MAVITSAKSKELAQVDASPQERLVAAKAGGRIRVAYGEYEVDAADEIGSGGEIEMLRLPEGATIVDAHVVIPASGTDGGFTIGWDGETSGVFGALDPSSAAVDARMTGVVAGFHARVAAARAIKLYCTETTADSGGDTFKLAVHYVID